MGWCLSGLWVISVPESKCLGRMELAPTDQGRGKGFVVSHPESVIVKYLRFFYRFKIFRVGCGVFGSTVTW